jgi:hypothetical protein
MPNNPWDFEEPESVEDRLGQLERGLERVVFFLVCSILLILGWMWL